MREELKSVRTTFGESSARVTGEMMRRVLCADNWATSAKVRTMLCVTWACLNLYCALGPSGGFAYPNAAFGSGTSSLYYSSFSCIGTESALLSCPYTTGGCSASLGAAVRCQGNYNTNHYQKKWVLICHSKSSVFHTMYC